MSITLKELKQSVITTSNYKGYVLPDLAHTLFSFTIADLEKDISSQEMQKIMDDNMTTTKTTTDYSKKNVPGRGGPNGQYLMTGFGSPSPPPPQPILTFNLCLNTASKQSTSRIPLRELKAQWN